MLQFCWSSLEYWPKFSFRNVAQNGCTVGHEWLHIFTDFHIASSHILPLRNNSYYPANPTQHLLILVSVKQELCPVSEISFLATH